MRTWPLVLFALVGCSPDPSTVKTDYAAERRRIGLNMRSQLVAPLCKGDVAGMKGCGLLALEYYKSERQAAFASARCPSQTFDEVCFDAYLTAFTTEVTARYNHGTIEDVRAACAKSDCSNWQTSELAWLESHNEHVFAMAKRDLDALESLQAHESHPTPSAWGEFMRGFGAATRAGLENMNRPQHCNTASDCSESGAVCTVVMGQSQGMCTVAK